LKKTLKTQKNIACYVLAKEYRKSRLNGGTQMQESIDPNEHRNEKKRQLKGLEIYELAISCTMEYRENKEIEEERNERITRELSTR
jgi:hypothetical protein